jgi:hypothetical protein
MDLIYKNASCVNVWLGEPVLVFPMIWEYGGQLLELTYLESAMHNSSPRWYDRVWVAQEYILATNLYFCYGSRRIKDLGLLESVGPLLSKRHFPHCSTLKSRVWYTWKRSKPSGAKYIDLHSHGIATVAACAAKDPRDRVYGVLGFINPDERALVSVDYSLPPGQVFAAATAASMVVQKHHKILGFVNFANRKTIGLPSWAVDFETVVNVTDLEIGTSYLTFLGPGLRERENIHHIPMLHSILSISKVTSAVRWRM